MSRQLMLSLLWLAVACIPALGQTANVGAFSGSRFMSGWNNTGIGLGADGYVIGERLTIRRPRNFFFDELSATVGYFTADPMEYSVTKRVQYFDERPNYWHFLVDKKFAARGGVSVDFTSVGGARTWQGCGEREHQKAQSRGFDSL